MGGATVRQRGEAKGVEERGETQERRGHKTGKQMASRQKKPGHGGAGGLAGRQRHQH